MKTRIFIQMNTEAGTSTSVVMHDCIIQKKLNLALKKNVTVAHLCESCLNVIRQVSVPPTLMTQGNLIPNDHCLFVHFILALGAG
jgi:hypothetical protein